MAEGSAGMPRKQRIMPLGRLDAGANSPGKRYDHLSQIVRGMAIPAFVIDKDHVVIHWNRACERLTGISAEELMGTRDTWKAYYAEKRPVMAELLVDGSSVEAFETYYGGECRRSELVDDAYEASGFFPHMGEEGKWLFTTATPLRDATGGIIGAIQTLQDMTDQKRAESERVRLEAQLRQVQKMEAIGTLAGGIAHDFNNILMPILINTELALEDLPEDSDLRARLEEILKAGNRAKNLVKQILTFSRQNEERRAPIQLSLIVKEALKLLRSTLPSTIEIRQRIDMEQGRDMVRADPTQIHQVLMNLSTNAFHAMRDHGGLLEVRLSEMSVGDDPDPPLSDLRPGAYVRLTVRDTGHGMALHVMERAFEPYFSTKRQGEGTGLGLSVVHGIIKSHNGAITVESEPGQGAVFHVFLPVLEGVIDIKNHRDVEIPGGTERVLVVDDEKTSVEAIATMLERIGYTVEAKNSSQDALTVFKENPEGFDLVITDYAMPGMSGAALTRKILAIRPDAPIILCTGFSEQVDEIQAMDMGVRAFIMKPFLTHELAGTIRAVLDGTGPGRLTGGT